MSSCCCHFLHLRSLYVLLSSFALLGGRCTGGDAECSPDQRSLLLHLKHGFSFPPNDQLVSWKPGSNCCTWEGVTCDPETGQIISLDLGDRSITGYISHSLFNLTSLQALSLAFDEHNGHPIPQSGFEKLKDLTHLSLVGGNFVGQLPIGISHLSRLMYLYLDACGSAWSYHLKLQTLVGNLSNLRELHIRCANMSSDLDWSSALSKSVPQLQVLTVYDCDLPGLLPKDILTFKNWTALDLLGNSMLSGDLPDFPENNALQRLVLGGTNLSGSLPGSIGNLKYLTDLALFECCITGGIPSSIGSLTQLVVLQLVSNNLVGTIPSSIGNLSQLAFIDLSGNNLVGTIPSSIGNLSQLSFIDLSGNNFQGQIPRSLFGLPALEILDLSSNNFSGKLKNLTWFSTRSLQILDFSNNNLSGSIPRYLFEGSSSLNILNLRGNRLQGTIPLRFAKGCNLEILVLSDNHLEGPLPRSLVNCSALRVLDIGNNHIVDPFPFWLGSIVNLTVLILRSNALYGPVKSMNSHEANKIFPKLQLLDLSSNHLDGDLPSKYLNNLKYMMSSSTGDKSDNSLPYGYDYGVLAFMNNEPKISLVRILTISYTSVDFSNNHFEGDIPMVIGELQGLYKLNLSNNALTGRIPSAIGNMTQLESLDLSANHLSGDIPQELTSLTFLSSLNLSTNNFSGQIPQGGQLSTFPDTSFDGNPGLCGIPLVKKCKNAAPRIANSVPPSKSDSSWFVYVVCLALFTGLGFGVGMTIFIVLQNVPLKFWKRENGINV